MMSVLGTRNRVDFVGNSRAAGWLLAASSSPPLEVRARVDRQGSCRVLQTEHETGSCAVPGQCKIRVVQGSPPNPVAGTAWHEDEQT